MPETKTPFTELPRVIDALGEQLDLAFARAGLADRLSTTPSAAPRRSRRRGFAIAFAVAAVVAVALMIAGVRIGDRNAGLSDALGDVAQRIEVAPQPKRSQFLYSRSVSTNAQLERAGLDYRARPHKSFVVIRPHYQSSWLSVSQNGRLRMRGGKPIYPTASDAAIGKPFYASLEWFEGAWRDRKRRHQISKIWWKLAHWNEAQGQGTGVAFPESQTAARGVMVANDRLTLGGELLTAKQVKQYPRDPAQIYARVRREFVKQDRETAKAEAKFGAKLAPAQRIQKGENPDVEESVWSALSQSSGDLPAPQELRSAVVRALAFLPGVQAEGRATDPRGRSGDLFTWEHKGKRFSVIFDAESSVVLSAQSVVIDPSQLEFAAFRHLPAGTKLTTYELIERRTIDRLPKRN